MEMRSDIYFPAKSSGKDRNNISKTGRGFASKKISFRRVHKRKLPYLCAVLNEIGTVKFGQVNRFIQKRLLNHFNSGATSNK